MRLKKMTSSEEENRQQLEKLLIEELNGMESNLEMVTNRLKAYDVIDSRDLSLILQRLDLNSITCSRMLGSHSSILDSEFAEHLQVLENSASLQKKVITYVSGLPQQAAAGNRAPSLDYSDTLQSLRRSIAPNSGLHSIVGLAEAKQLLADAVVMPMRYNHLFTGGRKPWSSVLLYGPPGTGKTRLAHAVAAEVEAEFYVITPADLLSKWFGETEQKIRDLFGLIRKRSYTARCIVFLDEVDGLCRRRTDGEAESTRRMKSELLNQLQEQDTQKQSLGQLFFICATNCPWDIDTAFLRRFQRRIFISLPDRAARLGLIQQLCENSELELSSAEWEQLLHRTEGFSGSDLADLVKGALYQPLRELSLATHWERGEGPGCTWTPCSSNKLGAIRTNLKNFPPESVRARNVCVTDFLSVIDNTHPTVSQQDLIHYDRFTSQFGQLG